MKSFTRKQLIKAQIKYNADVLANPDKYEDFTVSATDAIQQVDCLISFIE